MRSVSSVPGVPERSCSASVTPGTRCVTCEITESEAESLMADPRVKTVQENKGTKISPMGVPSGSVLNLKVNTELVVEGDIVVTKRTHEIKRHTRRIPGALSIQSLDKYASIEGLPGGSGVDMVVVDGTINPNNPEMKNGSGSSRVKNADWNMWAGLSGSYSRTFNPNSENDNHGQHVAGTCGGLLQGWARDSDIYNVYPYDANVISYLLGVKNWHSAKVSGNPTVTNHSYGTTWDSITDVRYILSVTVNGSEIVAPRNDVGAVVSASGTGSGMTFSVLSGGLNYKNPPDISFHGGGWDSATAELANNSVYEINITNSGSGYTDGSPPSVTFGAVPSGGVRATGRCEVVGGKISKVVMINRGRGYSSAPSMTFGPPGAGGTQATGTVTIGSKFITGITITNGGSGHSQNLPSIVISGGGCSVEPTWVLDNDRYQASVGTGVLQNGLYKIAERVDDVSGSAFKQTPMGGSYLSTPTVSFIYKPGSGDGPFAKAIVSNGSVTSVLLVSPGGSYSSPPTVVLTNGGGFTPSQLRNWGVGDVAQYTDGPEADWNYYVFDTPQRNATLDSMAEDLISAGVIVVSSAGNSGSRVNKMGEQGYDDQFKYLMYTRAMANPSITEEPNPNAALTDSLYFARGMSPSAADGVICVGSLSSSCCPETKSAFSNAGTRIDVYASGGQIMSCVHSSAPGGKPNGAVPHPVDASTWIVKYSGTSMASPQVSGAIACYAESNRGLNQAGAVAWLTSNAKAGISNGSVPYSRFGGPDRILNYPGLTVSVQS